MYQDLIVINPADSVAVACRELREGELIPLSGGEVRIRETIPAGHKTAIRDLAEGEAVVKYGSVIGYARCPIGAGSWVHTHNLHTGLKGLQSYTYEPAKEAAQESAAGSCEQAGEAGSGEQTAENRTFRGYLRRSGEAGTRNDIWIIPLVSCVNRTVRRIVEKARPLIGGRCDDILALPHNAGCSQLGEDLWRTQKILANLVHHPNAGGVLLVSLGCENNDFEHFLPVLGDVDPERVRMMICQEVDGDETERGLALVEELLEVTKKDRRVPVPVTRLKIGMKCGSSDGFSGITANPLCGMISDRISALGGTAFLTEVPEMFGAETFLMNRCVNEGEFRKVVSMINGFKEYFIGYHQPVYENPSPGNVRQGITTLEEKSLGCIQKGGKAPVTATLDYGERSEKCGLNLMTGPGNDSVSITNLVSGGAQVLLFTTGGGNPLGTVVPTIKISSNTKLYQRKGNWIDFDAGSLIETGDYRKEADRLWTYILEVASGRRTRNEEEGYQDILIFKDGVTL